MNLVSETVRNGPAAWLGPAAASAAADARRAVTASRAAKRRPPVGGSDISAPGSFVGLSIIVVPAGRRPAALHGRTDGWRTSSDDARSDARSIAKVSDAPSSRCY